MKDFVLYFSKNQEETKKACEYSIKKYGDNTIFLGFSNIKALNNYILDNNIKCSLLELDNVNSSSEEKILDISNAAFNKLMFCGTVSTSDAVFNDKNKAFVKKGDFYFINDNNDLIKKIDTFYELHEEYIKKLDKATDLKTKYNHIIEDQKNIKKNKKKTRER